MEKVGASPNLGTYGLALGLSVGDKAMSQIKLGIVVDDRARTFRMDHGFSEGDHIVLCLPEDNGREFARYQVTSVEWLAEKNDRPARWIITTELLWLDL